MAMAEATLNEALEAVPVEKIDVCKEVLQVVYDNLKWTPQTLPTMSGQALKGLAGSQIQLFEYKKWYAKQSD